MGFLHYQLLLGIKLASRSFYSYDVQWVDETPENPWNEDLAIIAILNHTSLYEPLLAGGCENRLLRQIAYRGTIPVAAETLARPLTGAFFRRVAPRVVPITRQRDHTWTDVLSKAGSGSLVVILPEGRMKRATGLDKHGKPMTMRGGIADLLRHSDGGTMLFAYSGGLHHVQVPGQTLPRLFKKIRMRFELVDIDAYRNSFEAGPDDKDFKLQLVRDLERRRDEHCPTWDQPPPLPLPSD